MTSCTCLYAIKVKHYVMKVLYNFLIICFIYQKYLSSQRVLNFSEEVQINSERYRLKMHVRIRDRDTDISRVIKAKYWHTL
jgi:hypothetical protein